MADLQIKVTAMLDPLSSKEQIQTQLNTIAKDLKIPIGIDSSQLKNFQDAINKIQTQLKNTKPVNLFDPEQEAKLKNSLTTFDQVIAKYKDLGTVKINKDQINPLTGQLEKFSVQVTKSSGEVEKLKYELASLNGLVIGGQENKLYLPTQQSLTDNTQAIYEKQLQQEQAINTRIQQDNEKAIQQKQKSEQQAIQQRQKSEQSYENWWLKALNNKEQQELKQEQQLIEQMEQYRLQSLQRVQQREIEWNSSQQQAVQRNGDLERQEIARTQASRQQYENWWSQAVNNRELQNKNLQQSLLSQADHLLNSGSSKLDYSGVNNLVTNLRNLDTTSATANRQLMEAQHQLREYSNQVNHAHESTLTFGESLKQAFSGLALWSATATILYTPIRALQDMTQRLIEIDTQMTEIKRVMDEPDFKFTQMLQTAVNTSDQLSSKLTDVLSIMSDFGRMGFNDSQLTDITKTAQVLQNISDLNASDSVDTLTSAMLNFNIASSDSIKIAD